MNRTVEASMRQYESLATITRCHTAQTWSILMRKAWFIAGLAVVVVAGFQSHSMGLLFSAPILNDVATDLNDPPTYVKASTLGPLPESFKAQIAGYYKDLAPLVVDKPPGAVYDVAVVVAKETPSWELTLEDKDAGIIEGIATSKVWKFKDDFVIRIRPSPQGSVVDMRSKSRLGKGDLGANAARIQTFLATLQAKL